MTERNAGQRQRTHADPSQPIDRDADRLHHASHHAIEPFVDDDGQDDALPRLAEDANLVGNDATAVEHHAVAQALHDLRIRPVGGQDLVLLGQPVARVHDSVGDGTVVRQQE